MSFYHGQILIETETDSYILDIVIHTEMQLRQYNQQVPVLIAMYKVHVTPIHDWP